MENNKSEIYLTKKVMKTISKYDMISPGDKVLAALSGGKDSLVMLHILKLMQKYIKNKFQITAVHILSPFSEVDINYLKEFCKNIDIELIFGEIEKDDKKNINNCFSCAWYRRKTLFNIAYNLGFQKIAFGHHLDDVVETLFLNMVYNANLYTMEPIKYFFNKKICIIRPMYLIHEQRIEYIFNKNNWNTIEYKCPYSDDSKRQLIKSILKELNKTRIDYKENILTVFEKYGEKFEK